MALGAFYAGQAINISKTTGPHAFSYYITSKYGVPHGDAVSMSFPFFILNNFDGLEPDRKEILKKLYGFETKEQFFEIFKNIRKAINLNTTFCSLGINKEPHLTKFLQGVNHQRLSNNPVKIDIEAMRKWIGDC
jgi:alcohol dehydrogenase class IV